MKPLFNEKINESLKKYQPIEVILRQNCDKCGHQYDLYKFENGYEYKDGCECEIQRLAYEEYKRNKQKKLDYIFNQSNVNPSLRDATVNNYKPQNEKQVKAKQTAIEYVQGFSTKEPKSLILQGSYGTGKSHLAYAIAKAVKAKGHTVAFMHIPMLMDRIKATYNKNAVETTDELVRLLSDIENIGQRRLFEWLRQNGFLIKRKGVDYNMPTQYSMERELFEIKETSITHSDGHTSISKTPKVTGKGQQYFVNKFLGEK
ncbi:phage antirepressor KilAC domain-containing protein [Staphylococcus aureus]|nr:phage antirepressor KilAC domain-containing protein [Staphylococcus aureus]ENN10810.1 hypothetical protein UEA_01369 [Staphylococcus aureus M1481]